MFITPLFGYDERLAAYINETTVLYATGLVSLAGIIGILVMLFERKNHFDVAGKTCLLTGASSGMGLAVARQLSAKGANIAIIARDTSKLSAALESIKAAARNPTQRFASFSADLTSLSAPSRVVKEVTEWNSNTPPDIVWSMAGSSNPQLFIDTPPSVLRAQMETNYFTSTLIAHAILTVWLSPPHARSPKPRHLIFTSSTAAFYPITGYAPYSPCKAALRTLSDTLAQEVLLYSDSVHLHTVCPGSIDTPGFAAENLLKPAITKQLESSDPVSSPEEVARGAIKGLEGGEYLVVTNLIGRALRAISWGSSRRSCWVVDTVFGGVMNSVFWFIKKDLDGQVRRWGKEKGHPSSTSTIAGGHDGVVTCNL